jgi:hypothetical protein
MPKPRLDAALLEAINLVRNMAYEFDRDGGILYDLVDDDDDAAQNEAARGKQEDALDAVDRFLIDHQIAKDKGR